jgi:hypothetical protein
MRENDWRRRIMQNINPAKQIHVINRNRRIRFKIQLFLGRIVNRHVAYGLHHALPDNHAGTSGFTGRFLPHSLNHAQNVKIPERFSLLPATVEAHLSDA